ncbi:MAG: hypothetical protein A3B74_00875 [Candidatus Kerfeldbacteria bacterium RIFCSPHIGHO2_02_FULL_42_14]|uniref:FAD/NAD(P)-binding domain-containing protein n=1 Tax=Candidatus Kerfeldbacteria bacterium RIFCSPHIGHO2_02_FULL_42_14 TaxID=1798540 RepID=A0A1G2AS71_9BACT|nr:MAG: hypothetical protein A3B74_00875 [Candidatus Kerfeldbacteria bacterium RIFCSPHIGHO2_02_FULL_42_14]OGY81907.1 MAG: hypothetical protein A3E60_00955 [Candidatus Kerfeldbacteria bacterium RIFCSPHIGHO2_12_FULL_42_13]OGY83458.1 MAG: hypothetical protein A3I91_02300 [Candidatus Kerfeldbacteria bacterium RIFCSPLOWO2_02_FULL_42_19]OGY87016.1 MAG: hypothetical protein A3G01_01910 [Candidatus Kerfeldbacteria bacterium RIFCSPLOWO2_12_FULL_43_9]
MNVSHPYDLIIIGAGPGGCAAAVYAGRKQLKTLVITESFGGQSIVSNSIENWIGEKTISGVELAKKLEAHVRAQETVTVKTGEKVIVVREVGDMCISTLDWKKLSSVAASANAACEYEVTTDKGGVFRAKALLVASGGRRRRLDVLGEAQFDGKGVSYCSTCDAPLFRGKDVAVVGGGNAGLEACVDLFPYAKKIYLLNIGDKLGGDPITQKQVFDSSRVTVIHHAQTMEIFGETLVTGLKYQDTVSGVEKKLAAQGVFVEIGSIPNSEFVKDLVQMNKYNEIIVDHKTLATSRPGIFAAGDVTDEIYKQNNTSVGDAVSATLSAYNYLLNISKQTPAAQETV